MSQPPRTSSWGVVVGGWAVVYLALPVWMVGASPSRNLAFFLGLVGYFALAALLLRLMRLPAWPKLRWTLPHVPRQWPFVVVPWLAVQIVAQWGHGLELGYGDEELHAGVPAKLFDLLAWRAGHDLALWWRVGAWVVVAGIVTLVLRQRRAKTTSPKVWLLLPLGLALHFPLYQWLFAHLPESGIDLHRYPPFDPAIRLLSLMLFGVNELALRLPGLLLALMAAWYVYRLVELTFRCGSRAQGSGQHGDGALTDQSASGIPCHAAVGQGAVLMLDCHSSAPSAQAAGVLAAVILLYMPVFMHWSLQVYLVGGQAAFAAASAYYLTRHLQERDSEAAAWAFYLAGLAVLYERMMLIVAPLLLVSLLVWRWWGGVRAPALQSAREYLKLFVLSVLTMLPWLVITKLLGVRPPLLSRRNWLDPDLVLAYPLRFVSDVTIPLALLVVLGLALAIIRYRALAGAFFLLWSGALYLIYTSDAPEWIPTSRFLVVLAPGWAYLAALALHSLGRMGRVGEPRRGSGLYCRIWTIGIAAWLLLSWLWPHPVLSGAGQDIARWRQVNQPIDAAFRQLAATKALDGQLVLDLTYCSTSAFYCAKYRLRPQRLVRYSWYEHRGRYWRSPDDIYRLAQEQDCHLVMFALPACLEPYEGGRQATRYLRDLGRAPGPLFAEAAGIRNAHGGYHVLKLEGPDAR